MAQPGAVIDVVRSPSGADEFLEKVGFLVGTLCAAKAGKAVRTLFVADFAQPARDEIEGLLPAGFAEGGKNFFVIDQASGFASAIASCGHVGRERSFRLEFVPADQWLPEPL